MMTGRKKTVRKKNGRKKWKRKIKEMFTE